MQQGDQYELPIRIGGDDDFIVTPYNCADVKIAIKKVGEKTYRSGELRFDNDYWLYPLTQADTLPLGPVAMIQAQVKFDDGSIVNTPLKAVEVGMTLIRTVWQDEPQPTPMQPS